ncbi:MAG: hypothetical protein FJZ01_06730 [Candidatus Sericytochromatia bacterium]|nr:hypothetical protein [Candidatus Tanganyikabacteria bacterium]
MPCSRQAWSAILAAAAGLLSAGPAQAGVISTFTAYDTVSAFPTAGAIFDTRLGIPSASAAIPVLWTTSLVMGNGGWELGLGSNVVSPGGTGLSGAIAFDSLSPWARVKLPTLFGIPLVFLAGATIPAATGSSTTSGVGLGASFNWDGDQVDVNVGTRVDLSNPGTLAQGAVEVAFTHPLGKDFAGVAEVVFHAGNPSSANKMIERLGFVKTFNDNWAADLAVTLDTPLGSTASLAVLPSLGLSYRF